MWAFPLLGKVSVPARFVGFRPFVVAGPVLYRLRTTEHYERGYVWLYSRPMALDINCSIVCFLLLPGAPSARMDSITPALKTLS